jgi:hypothetical protein
MTILAGGTATGIEFSDTHDEPHAACIKSKYINVFITNITFFML